MSVVPLVQKHLQNDTNEDVNGVNDLVNGNIYSLHVPQGENYPAIVVLDEDSEPFESWGIVVPRYYDQAISINCYSDKAEDVSDLKEKIKDLVSGFIFFPEKIVNARMIPGHPEGNTRYKLMASDLLKEGMIFEAVEEQGETGIYIGNLTYEFQYYDTGG